ncbi:MAG: helix-turn-helix transcriptional regulator [Acidimicrobiia bacterium]|nr:helix-turn-helix transcriptional regulator [Acidimicrobiia bacterium]
MHAGELIRTSRTRAGLTLRELAPRAGTSHSTLSAYEQGSKVPSTATLARIVRAAGYTVDTTLHRRIDRVDGLSRGDELAAVLELAEAFPARHSGESGYPIFGR